MEQALGLLMAIAILAVAFRVMFGITGGRGAIGGIVSRLWSLFEWALRGILGSAASGMRGVIVGLHRECSRRWPLGTPIVEAVLILLPFAVYLSIVFIAWVVNFVSRIVS